MIGKVARVVESKGFCFVSTPGKEDHFLHKDEFNGYWQDLIDDFHRQKEIYIQFDSTTTSKGRRAVNASRTDYPNATAREVDRERNGM